ncbi:MAG TPA: alanine--tRNA ligase [Acidobacteriaceae bacterium]|nr:alanine--tRNA ligase [Acidobacteriaceae bacterium]
MRNLSGNQIREDFLRFFEGKGHRRVHSSSLVPANDPTLLFTNAGMNQFKDVFLGAERRDYTRATTSQKCVRAGGKHNDLENVGFTRRHHTFFEMLGNFSFGDYFKREAIAYAWELLTSPEWFGIDPSRLYVTIFEGTEGAGGTGSSVPRDDEAERYWIETGVPKERIFEMSAKDNFWQMGETGPCGPCSEIFFDLGVAASETGEDKPFPQDDQRYVEIWNLVFMQFDRAADGTLTPLPKPSIDTGMGLERIAAVLQGKLSNYESDLFTPLLKRATELTGFRGDPEIANAVVSPLRPSASGRDDGGWVDELAVSEEKGAASLRIIADHARAATFLISDGVLPSNEGRGYVLRKILRRGIRHGRLLGQEKPFMQEMVFAVRDEMQAAYPELGDTAERVAKVVLAEEEQFARTLELGLRQMTEETLRSGEKAFRLYETFGMPLDFMVDAARDAGIGFDHDGFERAKLEEQQRARASWKGGSQKTAAPVYRELPQTEFQGYGATRLDGARVLALVKSGVGVAELKAGERGEVVLDATSFYADSGGQVGDVGWLYASDHITAVAEVSGCRKPVQGVFAHQVLAKHTIAIGDTLDAVVNAGVRQATMRNHTGTHLLHAALRQVLGTHVKQAGSLNDPARLRFDFSHFTSVAGEELQEIEDIVNTHVLRNEPVETLVDVPIDVAVHELGAMALFGEKYGERVRVVRIGDFSTELCGGTHTAATGEIGLLKLVGESSVSSGVRRMEAVTGTGSLELFRRDAEVAKVAGQIVGNGEPDAAALAAKLSAQEEEMKRLRRELEQMRMKSASAATADAAGSAVEVKGVKLLARRVDALDKSQMRNLVDELRGKLGSGVVVLGAATAEGKVSLIAGVTKDLTGRVQAGKLAGVLAAKVGGKGGGRPDLAEAGGSDAGALDGALAAAPGLLGDLLA